MKGDPYHVVRMTVELDVPVEDIGPCVTDEQLETVKTRVLAAVSEVGEPRGVKLAFELIGLGTVTGLGALLDPIPVGV